MRIVYRQRLAQQETLRILTFVLLQEHELRKTLHAFGRYIDAQRARHGDDGGGNRAIIAAFVDACDERAVDLETIHGQVAQAAETRVARTEIIDGQQYADSLELIDHLFCASLICHDYRLSDF